MNEFIPKKKRRIYLNEWVDLCLLFRFENSLKKHRTYDSEPFNYATRIKSNVYEHTRVCVVLFFSSSRSFVCLLKPLNDAYPSWVWTNTRLILHVNMDSCEILYLKFLQWHRRAHDALSFADGKDENKIIQFLINFEKKNLTNKIFSTHSPPFALLLLVHLLTLVLTVAEINERFH